MPSYKLKGNYTEREEKIINFIEKWSNIPEKDKGELKQTVFFWEDLLRALFDIENPGDYFSREEDVTKLKRNSIDIYFEDTLVLVEQKNFGIDLTKSYRQSDGTYRTPFEQAEHYAEKMNKTQMPNKIVVSNFDEFHIYDFNHRDNPPEILNLQDLLEHYHSFDFLIDKHKERIKKEQEASYEAGIRVSKIYKELLKEYKNPKDKKTLESLNILCVRLVFCFYCEDAGIFKKDQFYDYISKDEDNVENFRDHIIKLFHILDQPEEERDIYESPELLAFPYVNGGLFENEHIEIPRFNSEIIKAILDASYEFNWSTISPTVFGALFESTLNPVTRRKGGMHYTSIENIHKVIDPLFLNKLTEQFEQAKKAPRAGGSRTKKLKEFIKTISKLKFLDPACGSGNFLTETYICLRRLENQALDILYGAKYRNHQIKLETYIGNPIKVKLSQFYGIEVNDFAVSVAKTALWIAESQMLNETQRILRFDDEFLPLTANVNIIEDNALRINWNDVLPNTECSYIMGNPPFKGMKEMEDTDKEDMKMSVPLKKFKQLDYVACWYFKSLAYMKGTKIETAFVSSNSITQGEQAITMWKDLFDDGLIINFAYTSFVWDNEAESTAAVHCVIIGFSMINRKEKYLYTNTGVKSYPIINQYLAPSPPVFIRKRGNPYPGIEPMLKGAQLIDGGGFTVGDDKQYQQIIKKYPELKPYIRQYTNAYMWLHNKDPRYVLYLEDCPIHLLRHHKYLKEHINKVYEYRANNSSPSTNILKDRPSHYFQSQVPSHRSVILPVTSTSVREYIPMDYMPENMVYSNALFFIDNASLYTFGVLNSNVHNAWLRLFTGRMKSDFRYANTIVYNTLPWPKPSESQKAKIEKTAQKILDARAIIQKEEPTNNLADLYSKFMPDNLKKAHRNNDIAVMEAYGFNPKLTEEEIVAELMKLYKARENIK